MKAYYWFLDVTFHLFEGKRLIVLAKDLQEARTAATQQIRMYGYKTAQTELLCEIVETELPEVKDVNFPLVIW